MSPGNFEWLLKDMIGLDAESIGASAIERAVKERQTAGRFQDLAAYWESLQSSETERQLLIEAVVVPETWFFRDRKAFEGLGSIADREFGPTRHGGVLRVLSVPCSSGEEPYSIAMTLHEVGLLPHQYRIDAADVSHQALAKGRKGTYGENSFRGTDQSFRNRYFTRTPNGYQLADAILAQVHFQQGNLLSSAFLADAEPYDVIFCRNLFIYFDRRTQQHAIGELTRLMAPEGVLFVGSSETGVFMEQDFVSANLPKAFAFRRRSERQMLHRRLSVDRIKAQRPGAQVSFPASAPVRRGSQSAVHSVRAQTAVPSVPAQRRETIEDAYQLADQGHFAEAAKLCDEHVRREGPSARAFYLLGLVRDASGNESDAESLYRKVLYLDPGHREALVQLALLMDRQGNQAGAQVLRNRMRRLEAASTTS